jgi:hypothetical protein
VVSDIPAGDGKLVNLFLRCRNSLPPVLTGNKYLMSSIDRTKTLILCSSIGGGGGGWGGGGWEGLNNPSYKFLEDNHAADATKNER